MANKKIVKARNILIINLGGIGDVLLSTPALKALRNLYPQANISLLAVQRVCELMEGLPYINDTFVFYHNPQAKFFLSGIYKNLKTLMILRKRRFDLTVNMRTLVSKISALRMRFLLAVINSRIRVGRDTVGRGNFFDIKIPESEFGEKYEMEYDIDTVEALGAEVIDRSIDFTVDKESTEKVDKILEREAVNSNDLIVGIHPGGGRPATHWPIENFIRVIKELSRRIDCKFIITGGEGDSNLINRLIEMSDIKLINVATKMNIKELAALINRTHVYISNDTGPMHIAAMLKKPLVAIFRIDNLKRYDPRNISDKAVVLYKETDCAPCNKKFCKSKKCLKAIPPEEVVGAITQLLNK